MEDEIWKPVVGFEGFYEVSNKGCVRSLQDKKHGKYFSRKEPYYMVPQHSHDNHWRVKLRLQGQVRMKFIHRLVAEAFIPNPDNLPQINHKDENGANNCVENLEWCTCKYNVNYGTHNQKVSATLRALAVNGKTIHQFTPEGKLIATYRSTREAARHLGLRDMAISDAMYDGREIAFGFKWKYANG